MREEESNWFARWEEELPTRRSSCLTSPPAAAVDISPPPIRPPPSPGDSIPAALRSPAAAGLRLAGDGRRRSRQRRHEPGEEPARTLKRPRLVWTPQLHKRFVDAVAHLGIKNAVPKTIMQLMNVEGLTRENVASHLQKYRLYLKRMQSLSSPAAPPGLAATSRPSTLPRTASSPAPPFCAPDHQLMPFVPVSALQHHQQMAAVAAAAAAAHQQQQYYHQRHMGHLGSPRGGGFEHGYLSRPPQPPGPRSRLLLGDIIRRGLRFRAASGGGGRRMLTLFPTGDD
ncbi:unnamed protein product [Spirodela intermedia]|uniref:HTH myb-type domain-containing protein n=1 Tax=Spirodela intermedia TaxID=51605 RepID=A0A7I8I9N3_SPIIN|nr:unnamed protein product [Spirodela intermedia]CAA6654417.1 unnamed protein product [Spirodela intermedia]